MMQLKVSRYADNDIATSLAQKPPTLCLDEEEKIHRSEIQTSRTARCYTVAFSIGNPLTMIVFDRAAR